MGQVNCSIHKRQSFIEVCEHINMSYIKGIKIKAYSMPLNVLICEDCKERVMANDLGNPTFKEIMEMPDLEAEKFESLFVEKYNQLSTNIICRKCAEEANLF